MIEDKRKLSTSTSKLTIFFTLGSTKVLWFIIVFLVHMGHSLWRWELQGGLLFDIPTLTWGTDFNASLKGLNKKFSNTDCKFHQNLISLELSPRNKKVTLTIMSKSVIPISGIMLDYWVRPSPDFRKEV